MKFVIKAVSLIIVTFMLTACGEKTFNATSDGSRANSLSAMMSELTDDKAAKLMHIVQGRYAGAYVAIIKGEKSAIDSVNAKMHGKTAGEIFALAE